MEIKLISEATLTKDGVETPSLSLKFNQMTPDIHHALSSLVNGFEEEPQLASEREQVCFYYYLDLLKKHGLIFYKTPLIELTPFNGSFSYEKSSKGAFSLSRFAVCHSHNGKLIVETPLCAVRAHIHSLEGLRFFYAFCKPLTLEEALREFPQVTSDVVKESFDLLSSASILTSGEESSTSQQWDFHDLFFHSRSRQGRQNAPYGGTFRFKGEIPPPPVVKLCQRTASIALSKPEKELTLPLEQAIGKRRSIREHGDRPITLQQLGEFLYRCAHVKRLFTQGEEEFTTRPYPGGGARYEFELYPIVNQCEGLEQGVYHYHPLEHELCQISALNERAAVFLHDSQKASRKEGSPQVLIVVGARFQRVSWKYQSMAYALILKNLGVLLQTMYLVATAMELAPCALGGGDSDLFCEVMGTDYLEETSVGEFMLGSLSNH